MNDPTRLARIRTHNRHRLVYALASCLLYAAFLLQYGALHTWFAAALVDGGTVTRGMLLFVLIVAAFLGLEISYMRQRDREQVRHE